MVLHIPHDLTEVAEGLWETLKRDWPCRSLEPPGTAARQSKSETFGRVRDAPVQEEKEVSWEQPGHLGMLEGSLMNMHEHSMRLR